MLNKIITPCLLIMTSVVALQCGSGESETNNTENEAHQPNAMRQRPQASQTTQEVLVETMYLTPRTINSFVILSSTIETESMVDVFPQVPGIITELFVEEGDRITSSNVLIQLDDREYVIAEQTSRVNFQKAEAEFNRTNESYEKNIISKVDLDNAKYAMESAELAWKQSQLNLSYTKVTSPIKGVVTKRNIKSGDRVQTSTVLFQIVDTSEFIARVFIPESEISRIRVGQEVVIISEFLENRTFEGFVKRMSPIVDPTSGTFKITVGIKDPNNLLRPGMFITVQIITAVHDDVIAVPKDAIVYDSGLPYVFKVENSVASRVALKSGFSDEQFTESLENFSLGDEIIIVGQNGLRDGALIRTLPPNGALNGKQ